MSTFRAHGIRRVALLDFDVHHGNGTEACVANTMPSKSTRLFETPFGEGARNLLLETRFVAPQQPRTGVPHTVWRQCAWPSRFNQCADALRWTVRYHHSQSHHLFCRGGDVPPLAPVVRRRGPAQHLVRVGAGVWPQDAAQRRVCVPGQWRHQRHSTGGLLPVALCGS